MQSCDAAALRTEYKPEARKTPTDQRRS